MLLAAAALVAGCAPPSASARATLDVYAASSLTEAFGELELIFETTHPGVDVRLTFAGSQALRLQIEQGAPADVFASANPMHMTALLDAGLVPAARTFAHNDLVVIVPLENPAGIEHFADLPRADRIVIGTESVPVGRYTREALARAAATTLGDDFFARVMARVVSEEANVRLARAKVELGEADAALVYRTDAISSDLVRIVEVPSEAKVRAEYLIGAVTGPRGAEQERSAIHPEGVDEATAGHRADGRGLAGEWIALVRSAEGQAALARHGFEVE